MGITGNESKKLKEVESVQMLFWELHTAACLSFCKLWIFRSFRKLNNFYSVVSYARCPTPSILRPVSYSRCPILGVLLPVFCARCPIPVSYSRCPTPGVLPPVFCARCPIPVSYSRCPTPGVLLPVFCARCPTPSILRPVSYSHYFALGVLSQCPTPGVLSQYFAPEVLSPVFYSILPPVPQNIQIQTLTFRKIYNFKYHSQAAICLD
jgi:hypothetical protein